MYEGAGYLYPLTTVPPHQTKSVDIRALRDNQVPDANGSKIPMSIAEGQIEWSMTGGEDRVMIGRSEQVDSTKRISSNYACINCCGNSFYDAWVTPNEGIGPEGYQIQLTAMQQDANCYGQPFLPHSVGSTFSDFISSICQPDMNGWTTLIGPGQTSIHGGWTADSWINWGGPHDECEYTPVDILRDALCSVLPAVTYNNASIPGSQASFAVLGGVTQSATLTATEGQCDPYSNFVLHVTYSLPQETRDVFEVTAQGFGNTSVREWNVQQDSISNNNTFSVSPSTGSILMTVNNKNGGRTGGPPYDAIQINVKGTYNSGATFSTPASVHIQCP